MRKFEKSTKWQVHLDKVVAHSDTKTPVVTMYVPRWGGLQLMVRTLRRRVLRIMVQSASMMTR